MRKIKLNDGSEYPVDRCGATNDTLRIRVTEPQDLLALVLVFGVPEKAERIEHFFEGTETDHIIFEGYTQLTSAATETDGVVLVLRKEA